MAKRIDITSSACTDIEIASIEARAITSLCRWVNEARFLIDKVRNCARVDPALADCLHQHDVRINAAEWEGDTAEGLGLVLLQQQSLIDDTLKAIHRLGSVEVLHG